MKENLMGQRFGLWTVIGEAEPYRNKNGIVQCACWLCKCVCGTEKVIQARQLRHGKNNYGCGCKNILSHIKENKKLGCMVYTTMNGKTFLFDKEDINIAISCVWYISSVGYAKCNAKEYGGLFHRAALKLSDSNLQVDHINGNRADNRKCNLRIVDRQQNCWNSAKPYNNTSGHKHVWFDKRRKSKPWRVRFKVSEKEYTWYADTYENACKLAEEKHKEICGEFSVYNYREVIQCQ